MNNRAQEKEEDLSMWSLIMQPNANNNRVFRL